MSEKPQKYDLRCYAERKAVLLKMGLPSYAEYLKTVRWSNIRKAVLKRDRHLCMICGKEAWQVHHSSYDEATMTGTDLSKLHTICEGCHTDIEFDPAGRKHGLDAVNAALAKRRAMNGRTREQNLKSARVRWSKKERMERMQSRLGVTSPRHPMRKLPDTE